MTPDRPPQRRRLTSPLHEMDGTEEDMVPETPLEEEMVPAQVTTATLAQIVRDEIQKGMSPLEHQLATLSNSVAQRLQKMEGNMNLHDIRIEKLENTMAALEEQIKNANAETTQAQLKEQMDHMHAQLSNMQVTPRSAATEVMKTMAVGGLQSLQTLEKATLWLNDKLKTLNGPCQQGTYMKSPQFQGLLFAKFSSTCERDTAVAMLRSAGLQEGGTRVWATQDLPLLTRARKMFLIGLKWQLTQWGFVRHELNIDDNFRSLVVGEHKVVDVVIENGNIVYTWSPQWGAWSDLQHSEELQLLKDRAAAVLSKGGKGEGKSKSKSKSHGAWAS